MKKTLLALLLALVSPATFAQLEYEDIPSFPRRILHITSDLNVSKAYDADTSSDMHRAPRRVGSLETAALPSVGSPNVPVVLVEFADRHFRTAGKTHEEVLANFNLFFNGENDAEVEATTRSIGSVRSYFMSQSSGTFQPNFRVLGPVTLDQDYAYYGKNSSTSQNANISAFYREALTKAVNQFYVDWSVFDNDQNGSVDMVFFIFAGWGENVVGDFDPDAIWPHERAMSTSVSLDDGSRITFACMGVSSEACYVSSKQLRTDAASAEFGPTGYNEANLRMDGIGPSIHELSHALGLPDFYDTRDPDKYDLNFGMDAWSVMDYGIYTSNSFKPCGFTAYERDFMRWQSLQLLEEPAVVTLSCFADGGQGCKVLNDQNANEYYILENRQAKGWDECTCSTFTSGLMVTHVDYDRNAWSNNKLNSVEGHPRMTIIAANNNYTGVNNAMSSAEWRGALSGNLFPYNATYQDLTDDTTPASVVYTGGLLHKPIRNITQNADGTVTFCFRTNGQLETPAVEEADEVQERSFVARWQSVEHATRYNVELYRETEFVRSDTLADLQLTYTDLTPSTAMKYRVKAMADSQEDYLSSEWSEFSYLETLVDAVPDLAIDEQTIDIYTPNGMKVATCKASELHRLARLSGIHIIRYADGSVRKMLLGRI